MQETEKADVVVTEEEKKVEETDLTVEEEVVKEEKPADDNLPKTEEELKTLLQSHSSKAKNELLKEIGLGSVKEIKENLTKAADVEGLTTQITTLTAERDAALGERDVLKADIQKRDDAKLIAAHGIPAESADLFLKLVDSDTTEGLSRDDKALRVKEQLIKMAGGVGNIGTDKTPEEIKTEKQLMQELQNL